MMVDNYPGFLGQTSINSEFNRHEFHVEQLLNRVRTVMIVKIMKVKGGGVGPAGTVDVLPLTKQVDGLGQAMSHGTVYGIPYTRTQGGKNAIINDPQEGDVGIMSISDRDISSLKANGDGNEANPGSGRSFNPADGIYHGAMLNQATPNQFIQFTSDGLVIADMNGNKMEMSPSGIKFTTAQMNVTGGVTAGFGTGDSVTLQHHQHAGGPVPDPGT